MQLDINTVNFLRMEKMQKEMKSKNKKMPIVLVKQKRRGEISKKAGKMKKAMRRKNVV